MSQSWQISFHFRYSVCYVTTLHVLHSFDNSLTNGERVGTRLTESLNANRFEWIRVAIWPFLQNWRNLAFLLFLDLATLEWMNWNEKAEFWRFFPFILGFRLTPKCIQVTWPVECVVIIILKLFWLYIGICYCDIMTDISFKTHTKYD